jgi:integration host factor subunit alpha
MACTKSDLIEAIRLNNSLTKKQTAEIIEVMIGIIKGVLASGDSILISGFGKIGVRVSQEKIGRNPSTGDPLTIKARKRIFFRCSEKLRDKINGQENIEEC